MLLRRCAGAEPLSALSVPMLRVARQARQARLRRLGASGEAATGGEIDGEAAEPEPSFVVGAGDGRKSGGAVSSGDGAGGGQSRTAGWRSAAMPSSIYARAKG